MVYIGNVLIYKGNGNCYFLYLFFCEESDYFTGSLIIPDLCVYLHIVSKMIICR